MTNSLTGLINSNFLTLKIDFLMVLRARGPPGTSPIDGELKNIWTVLFSDFFDHGDAGSDPFFDPT